MKTIEMQEAMRLVAEGSGISSAHRKQLQQQRLRKLVSYVRENSPYFARLYADLPKDFTLNDIPQTEKGTLLNHYNEWVTDHELTLDKVLTYVKRPADDSSLLLGRYTALCTSGSTGNPLPMVRDDYHNKIHNAMMMQRLYKGINPDLLNIMHHKIASVIHTSPTASSYSAFLRTVSTFPQATGNMLAISVLESIEHTVEQLNDFQPEMLSGYSSSLVLLASEKEKGNLNIPVKLIVNSAELLTDEAYNHIKKAFGCPILNNYCMTEGGEVAMTNYCSHLHLNEDWVIVEPVDSQMNPMPEGSSQFSNGILVTDLSNFVQPIIRYYVSDCVRILPNNSDCTESSLPILQIQGRSHEPFVLCGKHFTMVAIVTKAEVWPGLLKYQIVQTAPDTMQLRGVCTPESDPDEVLGSLAAQLQTYFLNSGCSEAHFTYTTQPLLYNAQGGKIPRYLNVSGISQ